jgi:metal-responsive CopG/Arc/MetJ family transcriptional regulator
MGRPKLNRDRIDITLPRGMGEDIARLAQSKGITRSELIQRQMDRLLRRHKGIRSTPKAKDERERGKGRDRREG